MSDYEKWKRRRAKPRAEMRWPIKHSTVNPALNGPDLRELALAHGVWVHVYTVRPRLRRDWSPAWAPLLPPRHLPTFAVGRDLAARGKAEWLCCSEEYPRPFITSCEALLSTAPLGSVFAIVPFGGKMSAIRGTYTVDWGEQPIIMFDDGPWPLDGREVMQWEALRSRPE